MNRLEKFRQRRNLRRKYLSAAFLFFFLTASGLLTADYITNSLMSGRQCVNLLSTANRKPYLVLSIMNEKIYINTQYINRDLDRCKKGIAKLLNMG